NSSFDLTITVQDDPSANTPFTPEPGTYPIGFDGIQFPDGHTFSATYTDLVGGLSNVDNWIDYDTFSGKTGSLILETVSPDKVTGSFEFTDYVYGEESLFEEKIDSVQVSGSFTAFNSDDY